MGKTHSVAEQVDFDLHLDMLLMSASHCTFVNETDPTDRNNYCFPFSIGLLALNVSHEHFRYSFVSGCNFNYNAKPN